MFLNYNSVHLDAGEKKHFVKFFFFSFVFSSFESKQNQ